MRKNKFKLVICLVILVTQLCSCSVEKNSKVLIGKIENGNMYVNSSIGLTMTLPQDWYYEIESEKEAGVLPTTVFSGKRPDMEYTGKYAVFDCTIYLDEYGDKDEEIEMVMKSGSSGPMTKVTLGDNEFAYSKTTENNGFILNVEEYSIHKNNYSIVFKFSYMNSDDRALFTSSVESLKFK